MLFINGSIFILILGFSNFKIIESNRVYLIEKMVILNKFTFISSLPNKIKTLKGIISKKTMNKIRKNIITKIIKSIFIILVWLGILKKIKRQIYSASLIIFHKRFYHMSVCLYWIYEVVIY